MPTVHVVQGQKLTGRELQVLAAAGNGNTVQETAEQLGISHSTVCTYLKSAYVKLNARNKTNAVTIALGIGELAHQPLADLERPS